jgi:FkbM family methyltransferase
MRARKISYADNFEDILLERAFPDVMHGFYIDVGAFEPVTHSVTNLFYERGWRGINIEPNPASFERLAKARPRDTNLNCGVSNYEGFLTLLEGPGACWSVDRNLLLGWFGVDERDIKARNVPVVTLRNICEQHVPKDVVIDFLKVDVEGHEREVVESNDWNRWRPRVVLVEANVVEGWEPALLASGYLFALFDGVNRVYVREEDRHLWPVLSVPVNVSDNFGIHGYQRRIEELELALSDCANLSPVMRKVARRLQQLSNQHPRIRAIIKPLVRRLAG